MARAVHGDVDEMITVPHVEVMGFWWKITIRIALLGKLMNVSTLCSVSRDVRHTTMWKYKGILTLTLSQSQYGGHSSSAPHFPYPFSHFFHPIPPFRYARG